MIELGQRSNRVTRGNHPGTKPGGVNIDEDHFGRCVRRRTYEDIPRMAIRVEESPLVGDSEQASYGVAYLTVCDFLSPGIGQADRAVHSFR